MNDQQAKLIAATIKAAYPVASFDETNVAAYVVHLRDLDFEATKAALGRLIQTLKFPPTIAEIRETYAEAAAQLPSVEAAWSAVCRELRTGSPKSDNLHPLVAGVVREIRWFDLNRKPEAEKRFRQRYRELRTESLRETQVSPALRSPEPAALLGDGGRR